MKLYIYKSEQDMEERIPFMSFEKVAIGDTLEVLDLASNTQYWIALHDDNGNRIAVNTPENQSNLKTADFDTEYGKPGLSLFYDKGKSQEDGSMTLYVNGELANGDEYLSNLDLAVYICFGQAEVDFVFSGNNVKLDDITNKKINEALTHMAEWNNELHTKYKTVFFAVAKAEQKELDVKALYCVSETFSAKSSNWISPSE